MATLRAVAERWRRRASPMDGRLGLEASTPRLLLVIFHQTKGMDRRNFLSNKSSSQCGEGRSLKGELWWRWKLKGRVAPSAIRWEDEYDLVMGINGWES